ncbi:MAG: hypothetical protein LC797_24330, partial [Chloroflexi bacterium]|nr:hypothetical protein [Chloroflexota bacterium]
MQVVGHIISIQEHRFRLLTDTGQVYLLTLAHNALVDAADLSRLLTQRTIVTVDYSGEPNTVDGVARNVLGAPADGVD